MLQKIFSKEDWINYSQSIDDTAGLAGSACGEVSVETQGSKKLVKKTSKPKPG